MIGINFPISDYYRTEIVDAQTISRKGPWWTAVLLIRDPKSKRLFLALYRWQQTKDGWKIRKRFTFRRAAEIEAIFAAVTKLGKMLVEEPRDAEAEDGE